MAVMEVQVSYYLSEERSPITMTFPAGSVLEHVREALGGETQDMERSLLLVNGLARPGDYPLSPGDAIVVMPILEGG